MSGGDKTGPMHMVLRSCGPGLKRFESKLLRLCCPTPLNGTSCHLCFKEYKGGYASCGPRCMKKGSLCHLCTRVGRVDTPLVLQGVRRKDCHWHLVVQLSGTLHHICPKLCEGRNIMPVLLQGVSRKGRYVNCAPRKVKEE